MGSQCSGSIDARELREVCVEMGLHPTEQELKFMVRRECISCVRVPNKSDFGWVQLTDVDADGSGEIDIDEFMAAMKSKFVDVESEEVSS